MGLVHTISHYQNLNLKEDSAEQSCTSLPQQWHKPGGKKIQPQAVVSMILAKPTKSPAERKSFYFPLQRSLSSLKNLSLLELDQGVLQKVFHQLNAWNKYMYLFGNIVDIELIVWPSTSFNPS